MRSIGTRTLLAILAALLVVSLSAGFTFAQAGGTFDLSWASIDGGGSADSSGGNFKLGGSIGQPDTTVLTGGAYTLSGGFWSAAGAGAPTSKEDPGLAPPAGSGGK